MLDFDTTKINLGLERVKAVLKQMGDPHLKYPAIHVAGTNGKGSVCAMLNSILCKAGYRAGLFTSPHLIKWNERIKVGGADISDDDFGRLKSMVVETQNFASLQPGELTPFEKITCLAFEYFAEQGIDIAVVEVGMGGRLDATNVVRPVVTIITNIDLDHTEYLGDTLEKIGREKAGILKPSVPNIYGETKATFFEDNQATVLKAVSVLKQQGYKITDEHVKEGLAATRWPGRFQIVHQDPTVILDGAHNPAGARALRVMIEKQKFADPITLIIGAQSTKNFSGIASELFPLAKQVIITRSKHPLAGDPLSLISNIEHRISNFEVAQTVNEAVDLALTFGWNQVVLIAGSLFVVGEALEYFQNSIDLSEQLR